MERSYWVIGGERPRTPCYIETCEVYYCELPECEAQHDDPSQKWDSKQWRNLAECYSRDDAERIVAALKAVA